MYQRATEIDPPPLPGEHELDELLGQRAIAALQPLGELPGLKGRRRIAACVLRTFFAGQVALFRARSRTHRTYRWVMATPGLSVSRNDVWYAVAILEQLWVLPPEVGQSLPLSHHRILLPIHDLEDKLRIASIAHGAGLSKRELEQLVRESRPPEAGGPPALAQGLDRIGEALDLAESESLDEQALAGLSEEESGRLLVRAYEQLNRLSRLAEALRQHLTAREPAEGRPKLNQAAK